MGNHRAERGPSRDTSAATVVGTSVPGKRRAAAPSRRPLTASLPSLLPSAPLVAGVTLLAVAAGGAVAFTNPDAIGSLSDKASLASANVSASPKASDVLSGRSAVVSRSGERGVVSDVAFTDEELTAEIEEQAAKQAEALGKINVSADKRAATIEKNQWVLPLVGYRLTATFGQSSYLWSTVHTGLDFSAPYGTEIVAIANGTITSTGYDGSYGEKTVLTLDDGTEIWYCHQSAYQVSVGDRVTGGQAIGNVGSTGNSTGNHLHLEVRPGGGDPINPYSALIEHGVQP